MIEVLQQDIFLRTDTLCLFADHIIIKDLADLETNLRVFVRIKRRDTGFGGTK